ncbi:MAG: hypothetical protein M3357_15560, partial [Actinomycetota bacterium]|nr:hypothetical protein [Actinomycetota bacterium]
MRGAPCPGCGRRVPETVATCLACGAETGDRLVPLNVGRQPVPLGPPPRSVAADSSRRRLPVVVLAGLAVMGGLNLLPTPDDPISPAPPAAAASAEIPHPPAAGVLARAAEAASQPGVVWPPPGPMRDRQEYTTVWTGTHMMMWRGPETGRPLDGSAYDSAARAWRPASPA